jgi:signal recognition particle subunit SRP54
MFEKLSDKLNGLFGKLRGRGVITPEDFDQAMREVRIALLEADVALSVVKDTISKIREKAIGLEVFSSVSPSQMVVKIVNDQIAELLGGEGMPLNLNFEPPVIIMIVGLQGSGKTTSSAKLAYRLTSKFRKKVLLASLDVYRPAAQQQLATLGKQCNISSLPIIADQKPLEITKRAMESARLEAYDVLILDTAGRLHIDEDMMNELREVKHLSQPHEVILVADSLTGQDAVNIAGDFNDQLDLSGIILTRMDGDGRGGAALSMKAVTGCPVKFIGVGEKFTDLEEFHPERIASRILGMGDIVSLVERAAETIEKDEAEKIAQKALTGAFDLEDLSVQLKNLKKMGGVSSLINFLPGMSQIKESMAGAQIDEKVITRQEAIISSMTRKERRNPKILNGSRKRRIASGAGVQVQDVNRLLKQFEEMQAMMKKVKKLGEKGLKRGGLNALFGR